MLGRPTSFAKLVALDGRVELGDFAVAKIQDVQHGPLREKFVAVDRLPFIRIEFQFAQRLLRFDGRLAAVQQDQFLLENRLLLFLQIFFHALDAPRDLIEVGEHQFQIEHFGVAQRIDRTRRMRHGGIVEDAQHVSERVHFAQRRKHGGILRAVFHHAADVDIFDRGVGNLFRIVKLGQLFEARFRHARHADVRGRARRLLVQLRACQNFEQSCLADLRKPDDPCLHRFGIVAQPRTTHPARRGTFR